MVLKKRIKKVKKVLDEINETTLEIEKELEKLYKRLAN